jgi:hypothetical protein
LHEVFPAGDVVELRNVAAPYEICLKTELDYFRVAAQRPDLAFAPTLVPLDEARTTALKVMNLLGRQEGINCESVEVVFGNTKQDERRRIRSQNAMCIVRDNHGLGRIG